MKVYVIVFISLIIGSALTNLVRGVIDDEGAQFLGGILYTLLGTLALVFTCIGW